MKKNEVIVVTLSNSDEALFVNGATILSVDSWEKGPDLVDVAKLLAEQLEVPLQTVEMPVPSDSDWNWSDVYELLPPSTKEAAKTGTSNEISVNIKHCDSYAIDGTVLTHQMDIEDRRATSGQACITLGPVEGELDEFLSVSFEVSTNPLTGIEHVPSAIVHFDESSVAMLLYKMGNKILVRPQSNVTIVPFTATLNGADERLYWME